MAPVLGLCALLAADAVLIGWAFRGAPATDPALSTSRPATSVVPSVAPTDGPSDAPSGAVTAAPVLRFVAPAGPGVAWVLDAGTCARPGTIWATSDGGDTWSRESAPGRVVRAKPSSVDGGFVVGGDRDCTLRLWVTGDAGGQWSQPRTAADAWSRVPDDDRRVHLPNDEVVRPCGDARVVDLTTLDARRGRVLCQNGEVRSTSDGGKSWPRDFTDKAGLALAMAAVGKGVLVRTSPDCDGVVAVVLEAGEPSDRESCIEVAPVEGRVSVATSGTGWWLVVGDVVLRAQDPAGPWSRTGAVLTAG